MKKQLLNLSFVAVALALYITANAVPVEPVATMNVPAATAIVIDGLADDDYGDVQATEPMNPSVQDANWDGETDFSAEFQVCADAHFLYMIAVIQDDVEHDYNWDVGNPWEFDNFEVFLQLDTNTTVTTGADTTATQLRICRALDSVESPGYATRGDYVYYMEAQAPGGWLSEVAIPWSCSMSSGLLPEDMQDYVGVPIGFDFAGADSDGSGDTGARDYQTAWDLDGQDGTEDLAWNDCSVFGYITMSSLPLISASVEGNTAATLNVHPNPATGLINLDVDGLSSFEIFSISGAKVMAGETNGTIDVSSLNSGIYMLKAGNVTQKFAIK